MPMGRTSYLPCRWPRRMEAAERRETSCSPERPPKSMPMRGFFLMTPSVSDSGGLLVRLGVERNHVGYRVMRLKEFPS